MKSTDRIANLAMAVTGCDIQPVSDLRENANGLEQSFRCGALSEDIPARDVTLQIGEDGCFNLYDGIGCDAPLLSGAIGDFSKGTIKVSALLKIEDAETFYSEMGLDDPAMMCAPVLREKLTVTAAPKHLTGLSRFAVTDMYRKDDLLYMEMEGVVDRPSLLVRAAREARFSELRETDLPATLKDAFFDITVRANPLGDPSFMGFDILEYPDVQFPELSLRAAEAILRLQPGLMPEPGQPYEDWLERTGLDDSFKGNGGAVPGTQQLFDVGSEMVESIERDNADLDEMDF